MSEFFEINSSSSFDSSTSSKQANEDRPSTKKRTRLLLLIGIALVITIVTVTVATVIPLLVLKKTTKQTTDFIDDDLPASTPANAATTYEVGKGGASGNSPCSSHTVINDPSRHVDAPATGGSCDGGPFFNTTNGGRWIRFIGAGGTMIPTSPPGRQRCGAFLTGWFSGILPSTPNTIVNATACVDIPANNCGHHMPISVVKCADFYVYFLRPILVCNGRYCTI